MFVHIFPFCKLPRRFTTFDYGLPETMTVRRGDVIRIPFRHREILGVVNHVSPTTQESRTLNVLNAPPLFSLHESDLDRLITLAQELGESTSSLLHLAYDGLAPAPTSQTSPNRAPHQPSLRIKKDVAKTVQQLLQAIHQHHTCAIAIDDEMSVVFIHALCQTFKKQILIVVPRERDATIIGNLLHTVTPSMLTGKTKPSDRNTIIHGWKKGNIRVLIGTRQATLLSPHHLDAVLVYQAGCEDHIPQRRRPYLNNRHTAQLLATTHHAKFFLCDVLPPISSLPLLPTQLLPTPTIIDATHRGEKSPYPLLTQTLLENIKTALLSHKKVLLSFNRKGVAKRLECRSCGHVPFCGTCGNLPTVRLHDLLCEQCGTEMWLPNVCPACQAPTIGLRTIGGQKIADDLARAFPTAHIGRIEKGAVNLEADILLVTEYFWSSILEPFTRYNIGLVGEILADIGFTAGDYLSAERTARKIARLSALATHERATCIIQTVARDRLLTLLSPIDVSAAENTARQKYTLPPYSVIIKFTGAKKEDLPLIMRDVVQERNHTLHAIINHDTFVAWQKLFPSLPDSIALTVTM